MSLAITNNYEHWHLRLFKTIMICLVGITIGALLFYAAARMIPIYFIAVLFILAAVPFLIVWYDFFEKILLAIFLLTLPIIIDKTFGLKEHTGGAKGFIISLHDIALFILIFMWLWRMMLYKDRRIRYFRGYSLPIMGVLFMAVLSMSNAADRLFSVYEWIEIFKMFLVFLYIANYVAETHNIRIVLFFLLLGLCIENGIVLLEVATGNALNLTFLGTRATKDPMMLAMSSYYRVGGTLGGANGLAWYLTFLLPIPFALFFLRMRISYKIIIISIFSFGLFSLFLTYSRGGWIGFILGALLVLFLHLSKVNLAKKIYIVIVYLLILGVATTLMFSTSNPIKDRLTEDDRGSAYSRIPLMVVAVDMIKANPVIGIGLNNYTEVHQEYDYGIDKITQYYPVPVHNVFLQLAAEIGIPGLICFFWFIAAIFIRGIKYVRREGGLSTIVIIGIMGGMVGFLFDGLVENTSLGSYNMFPLWIFTGIAAGLFEHKKNVPQEKSTSS